MICRNRLKNLPIALITTVLLWTISLQNGLAIESQYKLVISKSEQQLSVVMDDQIIKRYRVATGQGGKGTKLRMGDKKTPVGVYKIIDFNDESRFHYFMQLDYPNLLDAWYGYKNKTISAHEFKNIANAFKAKEKPPQDTKLGGYIGIHGLGDTNAQKLHIHNGENWTQGCIAITNEQIKDLKQYVTIGTQVIIKE